MFDSSAKYQGRSLNDRLYRGPDVANSLLGVLCRFRSDEIAYAADIKKMFHAFWVPSQQRDALRFFWWADNVPGNKLKIYRANVHVFGNCSSPAIATFALRWTTDNEEARKYPDACAYINRNFYVDDGLGSAPNVTKATTTLTGARTLLSRYNIRLHKIVSNHPDVLKAFPPSEVSDKVQQVDLTAHHSQSTLGVTWDTAKDTLSLKYIVRGQFFTKRGMLSTISSVYDPFGIIAPVTLAGRILQ